MAPLDWYYAKGNKQHGPVSAAELKQLALRGELKPGDLVWCEKLDDWTPAKKVGGLFDDDGPAPPPEAAEPRPRDDVPSPPQDVPSPPKDIPSPPKGAAPPKPVEAPPRRSETPPDHAPTGGAPPAFEESEAAFEQSRKRSARHVFDRVLELVRPQFTMQFVELTAKMFTLGGHYGLYLAMLVLVAFGLLLGVKLNELNAILLGMGGAVILFVLQYAAGRFFEAMDRLNRSTPARMCSDAFLDCYALLHMFGGLVVLLGLTVSAVQTGPLSLVLPAIGAFILCEYVAVLALNPESLNLTITSETSAGEEALGVLSLLVKLALRLVPVAFGVGVIWGTITVLYALVLVLFPPEDPEEILAFVGLDRMEALASAEATSPADAASPGELRMPGPHEASPALEAVPPSEGPPLDEAIRMLPAEVTASKAATILIPFAALPLLAYVFFLVSYLSIDVLRAILALPGKLDRLIGGG